MSYLTEGRHGPPLEECSRNSIELVNVSSPAFPTALSVRQKHAEVSRYIYRQQTMLESSFTKRRVFLLAIAYRFRVSFALLGDCR